MNWKRLVQEKYKVVLAAEENIWFHGRKTKDTTFDYRWVGEGHDQEGPAFYFTNDIKDAASYSGPQGIVLKARVTPSKLVSMTASAKKAEVEKLMRASPVFEDTLSNYDENKNIAFTTALRHMLNQGNAKESFLQVWFDFYRYHAAAYLKGMVALGYDGHLVEKNGGVKHLIVYNPEVIKVLEVFPYNDL